MKYQSRIGKWDNSAVKTSGNERAELEIHYVATKGDERVSDSETIWVYVSENNNFDSTVKATMKEAIAHCEIRAQELMDSIAYNGWDIHGWDDAGNSYGASPMSDDEIDHP